VLLESSEFEIIRSQLMELVKSLDERYGITINCVMDVIDWEQERVLPLLNTGISTAESGKIFRTWNDASPQKYVINGEIHVVPQDYCPSAGATGVSNGKTAPARNAGLNSESNVKSCSILMYAPTAQREKSR